MKLAVHELTTNKALIPVDVIIIKIMALVLPYQRYQRVKMSKLSNLLADLCMICIGLVFSNEWPGKAGH